MFYISYFSKISSDRVCFVFDKIGFQIYAIKIGYDCNSSAPDDGDYADGTPNCWVSCERLPAYDPAVPSPIMGDPCGPCDSVSGQTYSCTPYGCVLSACTYSPGTGINTSIYQTLNNCYTSSSQFP